MPVESVGSPGLWTGFFALIFALLAIDLGVFRREAKEITLRAAAGWTVFWVSLAGLFNAFVWWEFGAKRGMQFLSGYLMEEALSVDNVFVFSVILMFFGVPKALQHRVLFWGILGALVLRGIFIGASTALLHHFHFVIYLFGALLVYTGIKLLRHDDDEIDPNDNVLVKVTKRFFAVTDGYRGQRFFVREGGRLWATPLLIVLVAIESSDVLFAIDSIPAVLGVFDSPADVDPFIVYTSNIFAILGLRSLFFLVAGMMEKFHYLKVGLSGILMFIGAKMLLSWKWHVPIGVSLGVIGGLLGIAVVASLIRANRLEKAEITHH